MKEIKCWSCEKMVIPCEYAIPENFDIGYRCPNCKFEMSQQIVQCKEENNG